MNILKNFYSFRNIFNSVKKQILLFFLKIKLCYTFFRNSYISQPLKFD